jgi:hypothetical protein
MSESSQARTVGHIVADEEMEWRLRGIIEPIEIRDSSGKLLGHYIPFVSLEERARYEKARELFDPVEIERRLREEGGKGIPLSEFSARMHAQEKAG